MFLQEGVESKNDVFRGIGVEILLAKPDDFLKVKETLTRIGISSKTDNILYQSCNILHKKNRYAIVHFKELFILDGKYADICENDYARRNAIVKLLEQWKLLTVLNSLEYQSPAPCPINQIKIIPFKEKENWNLVSKYTIGRKNNIDN